MPCIDRSTRWRGVELQLRLFSDLDDREQEQYLLYTLARSRLVGHLSGPRGIVKLLQRRGYRLTQL